MNNDIISAEKAFLKVFFVIFNCQHLKFGYSQQFVLQKNDMCSAFCLLLLIRFSGSFCYITTREIHNHKVSFQGPLLSNLCTTLSLCCVVRLEPLWRIDQKQ